MLSSLFGLLGSFGRPSGAGPKVPSYKIRSMQKSINTLSVLRDSMPIDEITHFQTLRSSILLLSSVGSYEYRTPIINKLCQCLCTNMFTKDLERRIPVFCYPFMDCLKNPTHEKILDQLNHSHSDMYVRSWDVVDAAIHMIADLKNRTDHEELEAIIKSFCSYRSRALKIDSPLLETAGVGVAGLAKLQIPVPGTPYVQYPILDGVCNVVISPPLLPAPLPLLC